jgi:hypothetical protein
MIVVAKSLFGSYRLVGLWFWGVITLVVIGASVVTARFSGIDLSVWELITGQAAKYWLLVLGLMLVPTHLKLFVANGVTRRDFLLGAGAFGLVTAVIFAALVPIGRGVESLVRTAFGVAADGYPDFSAGEALRDFGHYAPGAVGWLITGALVAAGFYRYPWWVGLLLIIPFALPLAIPETLLGLYAAVDTPAHRFVPFGAGLALSLLAGAAGAVVLRQMIRDVAIRPSAG